MAFEPTAEEMASFTSVGDVAGWLEVEGEVLDALTKTVGAKTLTLRTWARIPASRWDSVVTQIRIDDPEADEGVRGLTPIEEGQVGELRSILAKLAAGPSPAIGGGGGGAHNEPGGGDAPPPGGTERAAGADAGGSSGGGGPGGTDAHPPARTGGETLALPTPGPTGTGPTHDARFGPAGTESRVEGWKRSCCASCPKVGRGGGGSEG